MLDLPLRGMKEWRWDLRAPFPGLQREPLKEEQREAPFLQGGGVPFGGTRLPWPMSRTAGRKRGGVTVLPILEQAPCSGGASSELGPRRGWCDCSGWSSPSSSDPWEPQPTVAKDYQDLQDLDVADKSSRWTGRGALWLGGGVLSGEGGGWPGRGPFSIFWLRWENVGGGAGRLMQRRLGVGLWAQLGGSPKKKPSCLEVALEGPSSLLVPPLHSWGGGISVPWLLPPFSSVHLKSLLPDSAPGNL